MQKYVIIYTRSHTGPAGTDPELVSDLQQTVEDRDDVVAGSYVDDAEITGRGKYQGWRKLLTKLDEADQVIVAGAGDLPGKSVNDLLKILGTFRDHGVGLYLHREGIDTSSAGFSILDLVEAFRAAKVSQAIKAGQARALAAGKRIGRPTIPPGIMNRVKASLLAGNGIRPTARRFAVSPASVINIRRAMVPTSGVEAA
jgi:DNA invertase Pin-like site-specific DNA recombinase